VDAKGDMWIPGVNHVVITHAAIYGMKQANLERVRRCLSIPDRVVRSPDACGLPPFM